MLTNDEYSPADVIVETTIPNLAVLPVGRGADNAVELVAGRRMERLMDHVSALKSRIVLCDTAPVLATSQSVPLLSHVAQTLFIVRAEATRQQVLKEALQVVGGAPNLALVLNQCQQTFGANYYYEYGGGYHADPKRLTQQ